VRLGVTALVRLSALMDEDAASGSGEEAELQLLALIIESYERSKVGPAEADPSPLNLSMILKLHQGLGIPADVLLSQTDPGAG
jgi:HTH-type transcriptional regulator/antitoxin HigA